MQLGAAAAALAAAAAWAALAVEAASLSTEALGTRTLKVRPYSRMRAVYHLKDSGKGYAPGSPLYVAQEEEDAHKDPWFIEGVSMPAWMRPWLADFFRWPEESERNTSPRWLNYGWHIFKKDLLFKIMYVFVYIGFMFALGLLYKTFWRFHPQKELLETVYPSQKHFNFGLCELRHCGGPHATICLPAWCCLPIRWADTMSSVPAHGFYTFFIALLLVVVPLALSPLTVGTAELVFLGICVYHRQKLRDVYGLESHTCKSCCFDCLVWWCCSCCAAAQEARQVEYVKVPLNGVQQQEVRVSGSQRVGY